MTLTLELVLYLLAVALLILAALGVTTRVSLGWLGLAVWAFTAGVYPQL